MARLTAPNPLSPSPPAGLICAACPGNNPPSSCSAAIDAAYRLHRIDHLDHLVAPIFRQRDHTWHCWGRMPPNIISGLLCYNPLVKSTIDAASAGPYSRWLRPILKE